MTTPSTPPAMTTPKTGAPILEARGLSRSFGHVRALNNEIAGARIYAGFHYRYSTVVGSDLGIKVGTYVAQNSMQPLKVATK